MINPLRPGTMASKRNLMRPPTRPINNRAHSATPSISGRASPADSVSTRQRSPNLGVAASLKRKDRDYEEEMGQETNINVVVRCRGRSDREVRENSGVVVSTKGVKGNTVDLSMGPNAVSNKTYQFDRVFSPAADQGMIFDEVVGPILHEVLSGFNCTIFAYGQTGTGKTYTMSGDIQDILPIPDEAGIIPRVLHSLFAQLDAGEIENSIKCSFIELYNEELRDLLAADESTKLKIFDDASRKSQSATLVQGMEETYIKSASNGIELLRLGSHKRQVAATKCNDLSSRSHTVFTITVYAKRTTESGEEYVSRGKLNLVDLAGSENIQRSGAENKRAAEAGLINKSLLTLGRVINALVDKSGHIPYRESKLTRLLQDSLGGRTKTCIIATLSPSRSNLEETISTLDYAFRAKNIRNKPQLNGMIPKKTMLREFTVEIEKLKSELIATRQRNGVYLTQETWEDMAAENESQRILGNEQRDRIETLEANLRNKSQELQGLVNSLSNVKKDSDTVKSALADTRNVLEYTEVVLEQTRQSLEEEAVLRKAHQQTEASLTDLSNDLLTTLSKTTSDIDGLHLKMRRRSDLQSLNRTNWQYSQAQVSDVTQVVEQRMVDFEKSHRALVDEVSGRLQEFVDTELEIIRSSTDMLTQKEATFHGGQEEVQLQASQARDEMNEVLGGIQTLRSDVKVKVGEGLDGLSAAAQRISAGVITELAGFNTQLHESYTSMGKSFKESLEDILGHVKRQGEEISSLRDKLAIATTALTTANAGAAQRLQEVVAEEKQRGAEERANLITSMSSLIQAFGDSQDQRFDTKIKGVREEILSANTIFDKQKEVYDKSMADWEANETKLVDEVQDAKEKIRVKVKDDWALAKECNQNIQETTHAIHKETVDIVDSQMKHMDVQLQSLDEILSRVRNQNTLHHGAHIESLAVVSANISQCFSDIKQEFTERSQRVAEFGDQAKADNQTLDQSLDCLSEEVQLPLSSLRSDILTVPLAEYAPTGQTPQKVQYQYTTTLPRTEEHDAILEKMRRPPQSPRKDANGTSPLKGIVFNDNDVTVDLLRPDSPTATLNLTRPVSASSANGGAGGLREIDINIFAASANNTQTFDLSKSSFKVNELSKSVSGKPTRTKSKRALATAEVKDLSASVGSRAHRKGATALCEGRENQPLSASTGPGSHGRVLRNRGS